jgi:hypothetical protein
VDASRLNASVVDQPTIYHLQLIPSHCPDNALAEVCTKLLADERVMRESLYVNWQKYNTSIHRMKSLEDY